MHTNFKIQKQRLPSLSFPFVAQMKKSIFPGGENSRAIGINTRSLLPLLSLSVLLFSCTSNQGNKSKENNSAEKNNTAITTPENINKPPVDSDMVYFKGGTFMMGSPKGTPQEQPVHQVQVRSFKIDKHPVTVKEFGQFIGQTGYKTDADKFGDSGVMDFTTSAWALVPGANWHHPLGRNSPAAQDDYPVTQVSWNDAAAYAAWAGKRLPTEAEWEYAARCGGKSTTKFSWGNDLVMDGKYMANVWQGDNLTARQGADGFELTSPVGHYGETACGLTDMGGNVWNWCLDTYKPYPGSTIPDPQNPESKVIRGGSFFFDQNGENSYTTTGRASNTRETSLFNTGFRCAKDAD
jgi:formylglycine-generating enzyme